ncbi:hypothetical protein [Acidipila sp. EB88]|uniref:hypothetical protein n=1 Tax=Acidipila sp. EB88 TaxID=2305226 RepID=UPI000F603B44|nr:hypothetical protein [Acidipila sp. EB88]
MNETFATPMPERIPHSAHTLPSFPGRQDRRLHTGLPSLAGAAAAGEALLPQMDGSRAFHLVVSAACYLSLGTGGNHKAVLEAIQILDDVAHELREGTLLASEDAVDAVWHTKQAKWERQHAIAVAVRFVKAGRAPGLPVARRRRSRVARWWNTWRGAPGMRMP